MTLTTAINNYNVSDFPCNYQVMFKDVCRQTEPGLVAFYDIRPGNGAGLFLPPRAEPARRRHLHISLQSGKEIGIVS